MNKLYDIFSEKYEHKTRLNNHYKQRPNGIDGIIIHSMGQRIKNYGPAARFLDEIGLSAHCLVDTDGSVIHCVEPVHQAYHAGKSKLEEQTNLNTSFIGIEILVQGTHDYSSFLQAIKTDVFTNDQYDSAATLCAMYMHKYEIPIDRVLPHSFVSGPGVRKDPKKDPGEGFNWDYFTILTEILADQLDY